MATAKRLGANRATLGRMHRIHQLLQNKEYPILHEKADTTDYPALLSDVLDGLLSMTETNWQELCEELAELLRPVVGITSILASPAKRTPPRQNTS